MNKQINRIIVLLLIIAMGSVSCSVFSKSKHDKQCMCPVRIPNN